MPIEAPPRLKLTRLNGPHGEFEIAFAGSSPDGLIFFYRDASRAFHFDAEVGRRPPRAKIFGIAPYGSKGDWASITSEEKKVLRENINYFFKNRVDTFPDRKIPDGYITPEVEFLSGIGIAK